MARERSPLRPLTTASAARHPLLRWLIGLIRSFGFAFAGIGALLRTQRNAQIHVAAMIVVVGAGWLLGVGLGDWIALTLATALVLSLEALNTALEAVVDLVSPQPHPLAKRAKDVAAGAVLIGAIGAAIVGCIVFLPKLLALIL
ncbi:MAG TPA: diacylglycerol kinase family protein [Herpetosiphonaceae bacterium]